VKPREQNENSRDADVWVTEDGDPLDGGMGGGTSNALVHEEERSNRHSASSGTLSDQTPPVKHTLTPAHQPQNTLPFRHSVSRDCRPQAIKPSIPREHSTATLPSKLRTGTSIHPRAR